MDRMFLDRNERLQFPESERDAISAVSVVIPAFNEVDAVESQVGDIRTALEAAGITHEIIVVDDCSSDGTGAAVLRSGARLIQHAENKGYGAALKTGILAARNEIIVIIDADGTYPAQEIPCLLERLKTADMVVGARVGESVKINWSRRPAKWFLRQLAQWIADRPIPDLNSGMRVFRRDCVMQYFPLLSNRFSFTTTVTLAYLSDDYKLDYCPIDYYPRIGKSKIIAWHFLDFLILIIRMSMMFNPLRIFTPLALFFGGLGVLKTIYDILSLFARSSTRGLELLVQPVLSTSAVLLLFVGLQFLMIGMVADGVIRRIAQASRPKFPSFSSTSYEIGPEAGSIQDFTGEVIPEEGKAEHG